MILGALLICLSPVATDGDTVKCAGGERVRLFGIQAPETGQAGAAASKLHLQGEITGGLICRTKGASYSRVVAICYAGLGKDVGKLQLDAGHATEWCSYSRGHYGRC